MANRSDAREPVPERVLSLVLYIVLAAVVVVSSHRFFAYIEHYPYWSIDDGMAVVSMSILQTGRYGDPAVPLEPFSAAQRYRGFYNYGPWFFATGAVLAWLFGFSVKALRSIHLLTGLALIGLGRRLFGGLPGAIATTFLGVGVCYAINRVQWPMFRPDPFVTLFAALAIWASARALITGRLSYWLALGVASGCGALTHLAGGTLLPASFAVAVIASGHRARQVEGSRLLAVLISSTAALVTGWIASAVMFYASFGFRFGDHFRLLLSYRTVVQKTTDAALTTQGHAAVWAEHYRIATSGVDVTWLFVLAGALVTALVMVLRALVGREPHRLHDLALLAPGWIIFICYCAGLGFYPNFHTGYVILPQLLGVWIVASTGYVALSEVQRHAPVVGRVLAVIATVAVVALGATLTASAARPDGDPRMRLARDWVGITNYVDQVLAPVPEEAVAWGAYSFAGAGPRRVQLTSLETALRVIADVPPEQRAALSPDYLIWSHAQTQDAVIMPLTDAAKDPVHLLHALLPGAEFGARALTAAVPYGATRVYARRAAGDVLPQLPAVSVWDAQLQRWLHDPSPVVDVTWSPASGAMRVTKGLQAWMVPATAVLTTDLPAGWYLFRVRATDLGDSRQVLSVGPAAAHTFPAGDLPPLLDVAARLSAEPTYLLWQHQGGPVAVDLFATDAAARLTSIETFRITGFRDYRADRERLREQPLPPLAAWTPDAPGGVTATVERDLLTVRGNTSASGYQLVSPRFAVPAGAAVMVRVPLVVEAGRVCVGVLDERQQTWVVPPTDRAEIHRFSTGTNTGLFVVVANCGAGADVASRFTLGLGGYAAATDRWYVDSLMKLW